MSKQQRRAAPSTIQVSGAVDAPGQVDSNAALQEELTPQGGSDTPTLDAAAHGLGGQTTGAPPDPNAPPPAVFTPGALPAVLWGNTCAEEIGPTWNKHGFKADEQYTVAVTFEDLVRWGAAGTTSLAGGLRFDQRVDRATDRVRGTAPDVEGAGTGSFDLHFSRPGSAPVPLVVANNGALALMRLAAAAYVLATRHGMADAILANDPQGWDQRPDLDVRCVLSMGGATEDADSRNCGYIQGASEDDFSARMTSSADQIAAHLARALDQKAGSAPGHTILGSNAHADFPNQVPNQVLVEAPGARDPEAPDRDVTDLADAIAVSLDIALDALWTHRPPSVVTYLTGAPTLQQEFKASVATLNADRLLANKQGGGSAEQWGGGGLASTEVARLLTRLGAGLVGQVDSSVLGKGGADFEAAFVRSIGDALRAAFARATTQASASWTTVKQDIRNYQPGAVSTQPADTKGETRNAVGVVSYPE